MEKRMRFLVLALLCSGVLNGAMLGIWLWPRNTPRLEVKKGGEGGRWLVDHRSSAEVLHEMSQLPLTKLLKKLGNQRVVEDGFTQRDFALAILQAYYGFDVGRALEKVGFPKQHRLLPWQAREGEEEIALTLYPDMNDTQYQALFEFGQTVQWPFTQEGLFFFLQQPTYRNDPSLQEAFFHTKGFKCLEMLFSNCGVDRTTLLAMVIGGAWGDFEEYVLEQRENPDYSAVRRRNVLLRWCERGSVEAATLLLATDFSFAVKKLHDQQVLHMLEVLEEGSELAKKFALAILSSPRQQSVCVRAGERLYAYEGKTPPEEGGYAKALEEFVPHLAGMKQVEKAVAEGPTHHPPPAKEEDVALPDYGEYIVEEGDSLWKIGQKVGVDVDTLVQLNDLDTDHIRPGKTLRIPN